MYSSWQETVGDENTCALVSIDPISKAGLGPLLCYIRCCKCPLSTGETILSAKMSSGHHLMHSVDHSTADTMRPNVSRGYLLGSVNSSLVTL